MSDTKKQGTLRFALILFLSGCALGSRAVSAKSRRPEYGLTVAEFQAFAKSLPVLPGRVLRIDFLRGERGDVPDTIGVLTDSLKGGWQLAAFARKANGTFVLAWRSGKLDDTFAVAAPNDLRTLNTGAEDVLVFQGCARHNCPGVFSLLLYVPSKNAAFTARYLRGKVTYSPGLEKPENRPYRDALKYEIAEQCKIGCG